MAHGYRLQATYESGYIHEENQYDLSPYAPGRNFYYDIIHHLPTKAGHGRLMKFAILAENPDDLPEGAEAGYEIDWREMPDDATPIHWMVCRKTVVLMGEAPASVRDTVCIRHGFGFTYKDPETGEPVIEEQIIELNTEEPSEAELTP